MKIQLKQLVLYRKYRKVNPIWVLQIPNLKVQIPNTFYFRVNTHFYFRVNTQFHKKLFLFLCNICLIVDFRNTGFYNDFIKLKLKIFIGMSAKLIANGHVQIYKYTEYGQWPNTSFEHNCKI